MAAADALVLSLLSDRGYPLLDGFEQAVADASVDHPATVGEYRQAHEVFRRCDQGKASTEDLRKAIQHYDNFLSSLLNDDQPGLPDREQLDGEQPDSRPEVDTSAGQRNRIENDQEGGNYGDPEADLEGQR
ncbi:MAG: hypothetical protein H0X39_17605 [Actinobacteria bacterium]|nr:hypothetical protein [Actinomycetota bacterium]